MTARPLIAVVADRRTLHPHPSHVSGEKYLKAVINGSDGLPVIVPSLPGDIDVDDVIERFNGLLLTGSYSNVEPARYGEDDADMRIALASGSRHIARQENADNQF